MVSEFVEAPGDEGRPPGLVASPAPPPRISVEVLVEEDQVLPEGVALVQLGVPMARPSSGLVRHEEPGQATGQFETDFVQSHDLPRSSRTLHLEVFSVVEVVALQGLDEEVVDTHPYRTSPVAVAPEEQGVGLARDVGHLLHLSVQLHHERRPLVRLGQGPHPVRGQELRLVQHVAEHLLQLVAVGDGE